MIFLMIFLAIAFLFTGGCLRKQESQEKATPPIARKIPKELTTHGHTRIDDYYWLKERDNPEVIAYLEAASIRESSILSTAEKKSRWRLMRKYCSTPTSWPRDTTISLLLHWR
jgi:hypothetical protein